MARPRGQRPILNGYQQPKLSLRVRCSPSALFDTVGVMTREGEQAAVVLNDGMGGSERKRVIEVAARHDRHELLKNDFAETLGN